MYRTDNINIRLIKIVICTYVSFGCSKNARKHTSKCTLAYVHIQFGSFVVFLKLYAVKTCIKFDIISITKILFVKMYILSHRCLKDIIQVFMHKRYHVIEIGK